MVKLTYCGGIPELTATGDFNVGAGPDFFQIKYGFKKSIEIPYQSISDASMKTEEQIINDASVLDFFIAGKMAFALKKKEITNYLIIDYDCGHGVRTKAIFKGVNVPIVHSTMLKQRVEFFKKNPQYQSLPNQAAVDVAAEIEKYHDLMEKGAITQEEFSAKKAQLLGL